MFYQVNDHVSNLGQQTEITLNGRLTHADYPVFHKITNDLGKTEKQTCVFNLSRLDFIDSAGVGMLLLAQDKVQEGNGKVIVRGVHSQVKKMIELGHFENYLTIENRDDA
ncbi:MAG: STAS domain-containing protein [Alphaproteobacteria bacterium]|nr:STAS domain-containing protein [Alphaproteobacteria bacterium]